MTGQTRLLDSRQGGAAILGELEAQYKSKQAPCFRFLAPENLGATMDDIHVFSGGNAAVGIATEIILWQKSPSVNDRAAHWVLLIQ